LRFNINIAYIKRLVPLLVYNKGYKYYLGMRVEDLSFDSNKNSVSGNVQGNKLYETSVIFDKSGDASGFRCNCPYKGLCKHVVALML